MVWGLQSLAASASLMEIERLRSLSPDSDMLDAVRFVLGREQHEFLQTYDLGEIEGRKVTYVVAGHNALLSPPLLAEDGSFVRQRLGGCRIAPYLSLEEAVIDAKDLSRGMSDKWSIFDTLMQSRLLEGDGTALEATVSRIGGGKSVIYIDTSDMTPEQRKRFFQRNFRNIGNRTADDLSSFERKLYAAVAEKVHDLKGNYIFAPDMMTDCAVMDYVSTLIPQVACLSEGNRILHGSGDPSIVTAEGVYYGLRAVSEKALGDRMFRGAKIGVQGAGKVGRYLIQRIIEERHDAFLFISDTDDVLGRLERDILIPEGWTAGKNYQFHSLKQGSSDRVIAHNEAFYGLGFDLYSPNARGQTLTMNHLLMMDPTLKGIGGGANNQRHPTEKQAVDAFLVEKRKAHAPDYVINGGGICNLGYENPAVVRLFGGRYNRERPLKVIRGVYGLLLDIITTSMKDGVPTQRVADSRVEGNLARYAMLRGFTPAQVRDRAYLTR